MAKGSTGRTYIALILASYLIIFALFFKALHRKDLQIPWLWVHDFLLQLSHLNMLCYQGSLTSWYLDGEQLPDNGSRLTSHHRLSASVPLTGSRCWCRGACGKPWIYVLSLSAIARSTLLFVLFFSSNAFSIMITHQFLDNSISPYGSLTYYCRSCPGIWGIWKDGWSWLVLIPLVGASAEHGHAWWLVMGLVFACGWPELLNERVKGASKTMFLRACRTVGSPGLVSFDSFRFAGFSETASKATTGSPCFHGW